MAALPDITWSFLTFSNLSAGELHDILQARADVFVVEQNCAFREIDGYDRAAHHLTGRDTAASGAPIAAYLRLIPPGVKGETAWLGRLITAKAYRGSGLGREAMRRGLALCRDLYPSAGLNLQAQLYLERFYTSLGFVRISDTYDEDGIPHLDMKWKEA